MAIIFCNSLFSFLCFSLYLLQFLRNKDVYIYTKQLYYETQEKRQVLMHTDGMSTAKRAEGPRAEYLEFIGERSAGHPRCRWFRESCGVSGQSPSGKRILGMF